MIRSFIKVTFTFTKENTAELRVPDASCRRPVPVLWGTILVSVLSVGVSQAVGV